MFKKGFTIVELMLIMTILGIVAMLMVKIFIPIINKQESYFANGALISIVEANRNLIIKNSPNLLQYGDDGLTSASKTSKNYCNKLFDELGTIGANNCGSTGENAQNITLTNGITIGNLSHGWTEGTAPDGRVVHYIDAKIDVDGKTDTTDDQYIFRIFKHNEVVVPLGQYLTMSDSYKTFKFYVYSKQSGIVKSTTHGISFLDAVCKTGLHQDIFLDSINCNSSITQDTANCENYWTCDVEPVKPPHYTNIFAFGLVN